MDMPITEKIVIETNQEVDGLSPEMIEKEMTNLSKSQPDLLYFVLTSVEDMEDDAKELGIYLFFVIYKIFKKAYGKIKKATYKDIEKSYDYNFGIMEHLENADEKYILDFAEKEVVKQPNVMRYLTETLMLEDPEEDFSLSTEDKGFLFLIFLTVIDILDKKSNKAMKV
ncbi:MAG TPA: hypothetical protein PLJ17_10900 [Syntrophorhabdaceae bacterium]|nr:hypothetical protein [Syntrophorhabdaceae bacterium]HQH44270.1 hypothetical protein [Syntrophorhabdaceae bacterium]HQK47361.1 hypothetical protein [Syntrophorhabdaceae bacterium]HRV22787.1 hypothetical protein [Syntrophorhabdaceae bacterium]